MMSPITMYQILADDTAQESKGGGGSPTDNSAGQPVKSPPLLTVKPIIFGRYNPNEAQSELEPDLEYEE